MERNELVISASLLAVYNGAFLTWCAINSRAAKLR